MLEDYLAGTEVETVPAYDFAGCVALEHRAFEQEDLDDIPGLTEVIKEQFRTALTLCDEELLSFARFAAEISADRKPIPVDMPHGYWTFYKNGFVYLFSWEGSDYLVLPDELARVYNETLADADFPARNKHNLELASYATALLNLYGYYEIGQFVEVWNHHHKEKIEYKDAEKFLSDLANFHSNYFFDEDCVVHDCLDDDEFDDLYETVSEMDYYMPTKSVIAAHSEPDEKFYDTTPGAEDLQTFLAGIITDELVLDDLRIGLYMSCQRLESAESVLEQLEDADFPLDDRDAVLKFERLYQNLRYNTHIWVIRGFTPYQYEIETGNQIKRFSFAQSGKKSGKQNLR